MSRLAITLALSRQGVVKVANTSPARTAVLTEKYGLAELSNGSLADNAARSVGAPVTTPTSMTGRAVFASLGLYLAANKSSRQLDRSALF